MNAFAADWLALREAADHRARDPRLRDAVAAHLAGRAHAAIVDLASGAGSNLRALAPFIAADQSWRLVDNDATLLAAARERIGAWADRQEPPDDAFFKGGRRIDVSFAFVDLARNPEQALDGDIDLVSAAAFFDLVSQQWIERFCGAIAARRLPLYAVLTYTGAEVWTPPHPADPDALAAFHAHQGGDKGFGPAAGPTAAPLLATALRRYGYQVSTAQSPWRLGREDKALIEATADGAAAAIAETGRLDWAIVEDWRLSRRRAVACEISHIDLFAIPA
jgi:hypothetical protein